MDGEQNGAGRWILLSNEFATVHLAVDEMANGPRLVVLDPTSGRQISLDPLELQALAWTRHEQLSDLLAPAFKEQYVRQVDPSRVGGDGPDAEEMSDRELGDD